mmetsp:Transcript_16643/g.46454  ORF Transcript_16643/g.46454 Transcript_16643/m.46454 type:complete len:207 (-) Transcript_16643:875-1495(-)
MSSTTCERTKLNHRDVNYAHRPPALNWMGEEQRPRRSNQPISSRSLGTYIGWLQIQLGNEFFGGVRATSRYKAFAKNALVSEDAIAIVLLLIQKLPELRASALARHHLLEAPAELILIVLQLHIAVNRATELQLERGKCAILQLDLGVVKEGKVLARVPVICWIGFPFPVPRLPKARFPEEQLSIGGQPSEDLLNQSLGVAIREVH